MPTTPTYPPPEDQHLLASSSHTVPPSPFLNPEQFGMLPLPESPIPPNLPLPHPSRHVTNGWDRRRLSTSSPRRARSESYSSAPPSISTSSFSTPSLGTLDFETPLIPASASTQTPMYTTLLEDIKSPAAASPS
ncbi:hypothetical protein K456DRAFT_1487695 [Colletotrichum gloeosporioides 23]|nr:hypothetical protein K456DRAFT_1487695 [Colletotrichum gloeosporioides 23]